MKHASQKLFPILLAGTLCLPFLVRGQAGLIITEVDLANDKFELLNTANTNINITSWWMCNRVNGSPFYSTFSAAMIDATLSTATSLDVAPGEILVMNSTSTILRDANGEFGIYNRNSFGTATAMEDYILWGANGVRDIVAANRGIWTDNDSIDVSGLAAGESIQLRSGRPGNAASDYMIGPSNLGVPPEPQLVITQVSIANTMFLCFPTVSNTVYRLESTPDLLNTNTWIDARISVTGNGQTNYLFDPGAAAGLSSQKFYRIVIP